MKTFQIVRCGLAVSFAIHLGIASAKLPNKRIGGSVDGFGTLQKDDVVDGAIVIPTLRSGALLAFRFENLLGPSEQMSAGPLNVKVPGNFYFPKQKENYGIFPITIAKENFGLYLNANQAEELFTLSFQAPFSKLVSMAQDKKPFTSMLPFLSLKKAAFDANRNWPDQSEIRVTLNKELKSNIPYSWTKSAPSADATDSVIMFQSTPAGRWAISDINGQPTAQGTLKRIETLGTEFKGFFIRAFTLKGEQAPYAVVGQIRSSKGSEKLVVSDLPEKLAQVAIQGADRINWKPINKTGWVSVARKSGGKSDGSSLDLSFGLANLPMIRKASEWVNPSQGYIKLDSPIASGESMLIVYIGTSRAVSAPTVEDENPDLFTFAEEIRMATIKK